MYRWLKLFHVLAAFTFIMGHGASIAFAFRLKRENDLKRVQAMFDLSVSFFMVYMLALLVMLVIGIILSFMGDWWSKGWVWVSLISFLGVTFWMFYLGQRYYHPLRRAFGMPYRDRKGDKPAEPPLPEEERAKLIAETKPHLMLWVAYGGFAFVLWLMMFKPF
jgi:Ca2+/Na+ antiporter